MKGVNRVVIAVKDIEKASRLFSELTGTSFHDLGVVDSFGIRAMWSYDGVIELVSPVTSECDVARFMTEKGEGYMQWCSTLIT